MSLLPDHLIKQFIPAVPKYLPHRLLHLFTAASFTHILLLSLLLSCLILLFSQFSLCFLLSFSILVSFLVRN
jgi:hypothetical protein